MFVSIDAAEGLSPRVRMASALKMVWKAGAELRRAGKGLRWR